MEYLSQLLEFVRSLPYWVWPASSAVYMALVAPVLWRRHQRFKKIRAKFLELRKSAEAVGFETTWWDLLPEGELSDATFERPLTDKFTLQIYAGQSSDFVATIYAYTYRYQEHRSYELAKRNVDGISPDDIKRLTYAVIDDLVFAGELDRAAIPEALKKAA